MGGRIKACHPPGAGVPGFDAQCVPLSLSGAALKYACNVKYFGIVICAAKFFKCSVDHVKVNFSKHLIAFCIVLSMLCQKLPVSIYLNITVSSYFCMEQK